MLLQISLFRISCWKSFLGSKNVALQSFNFLGSQAPFFYRLVSYKKGTCIRMNIRNDHKKEIYFTLALENAQTNPLLALSRRPFL